MLRKCLVQLVLDAKHVYLLQILVIYQKYSSDLAGNGFASLTLVRSRYILDIV